MKLKLSLTTFFCSLLLSLSLYGASHSSAVWYSDFDTALQAAQQSNTPLFVVFEGSKWCHYCKKLDKEILSSSQFTDPLNGKIIFVRLDFPRNPADSTPQTVLNQQVSSQYGVGGYPTVLILDSQGRKLAEMGYEAVKPAQYAQQVQAVINR